MAKIRAILFDMIGTTVLEKDSTVISMCFKNAFSGHNVIVNDDQIRGVRGRDKMAAIEHILIDSNNPLRLKQTIFESFKRNVVENLSNFEEHPQLKDVIRQLREKKLRIGIASGLPRALVEMLADKFSWQNYAFDYVNVYENFPEGRPDPAMIFDMCHSLGIDVAELLKVGDTLADIEEGKNAGSLTAVVLAGTQPDSVLRRADPDFVIQSLADLITILD